ncbi:hypothetical protein [Agromyces laixinhei]|uniref:hypothetical protein n=1 Tax=Agromyces laixinhei TaxID=2585717 RepID=UPI0012ED6FBD|nr:hypothetical protein [Agromyces laixinhei]
MASRHGIVSAEAADDLRAVKSAVAAAPAELQRLLADTAADQLSAAWGEELAKRPASRAQQFFVLYGARALPFADGLRVETGDETDPGLTRAYEFGTKDREKVTTYRRRSPKGRVHSVTRHTRRQLPQRRAGGYIAYPAANKLGARVFNMWAELVHKVTHDWMEGKNG